MAPNASPSRTPCWQAVSDPTGRGPLTAHTAADPRQEEFLNDKALSTTHESQPAAVSDVPHEVQVVVDALDDKRAVDIAVLDLRSASETLDWFIVASGESSLQLKALEDSVREGMKKAGHY